MTITHTVLPPLSAFLLAFLLPPVYPLFALAANLGDLAAGSDAARRPDVSFLRVRIAFNHVCFAANSAEPRVGIQTFPRYPVAGTIMIC